MNNSEANPVLDRAQGCLLGQFSGDSLGSLVEFMSPGKIRVQYPDGIKELQSGGTWNTIAGQPTDDSEMALALTRALLAKTPMTLKPPEKTIWTGCIQTPLTAASPPPMG